MLNYMFLGHYSLSLVSIDGRLIVNLIMGFIFVKCGFSRNDYVH